MSALMIDEGQLKDAIAEIEKLNPKPGASYASSTKVNSQYIRVDHRWSCPRSE